MIGPSGLDRSTELLLGYTCLTIFVVIVFYIGRAYYRQWREERRARRG